MGSVAVHINLLWTFADKILGLSMKSWHVSIERLLCLTRSNVGPKSLNESFLFLYFYLICQLLRQFFREDSLLLAQKISLFINSIPLFFNNFSLNFIYLGWWLLFYFLDLLILISRGLISNLSELAYISSSKKIVLHKDMPDRTIIDIKVLNNLSHTFTMNEVLENNRNAFSRIDRLRISRPRFLVAKNRLSIVILIVTLFLESKLYSSLFGNQWLYFNKFGSSFDTPWYMNVFILFHI